jgi:hypothetical protein
VAPDTPVAGSTEGGREFTPAILGNEACLDVAAAERDVLDAGEALIARHPHIGAVLLECTNMAIRNSDNVLQVVLTMAGRRQTSAVQHLGDLRNYLSQTLESIDQLIAD